MTIWYKNYSGCGYNHSCVGWGSWRFSYKAYEPNCYQPNDPPVANYDTFTSQQGAVLTLSASSLLSNDIDKNGDKLTITSVQCSNNGSVALVNGNVIYTPVPHYAGPASFTYTISDGRGGYSTATVNVTVKPVNYVPDAVNDSIAVGSADVVFAGNKVTIQPSSLLANDTDANGDVLTISSVQCATNGTVALVNGQIVFNANPGYSGPATFTYTVTDGKGAYDTAVVCLTIPKTNVNPDAIDDAMDGNEDTPFVFLASTLLDNDTDVNGDHLTVTSVQGAVNGSVVMVNGEVTFTPDANFFGMASFTYTVSDGKGGTDTATVRLNICAVNDAPDAVDDGVFQVAQNSAITILPATLAANDRDIDGDVFYGVSLQNATHGVVEYINDQVIFTPDANYVGPASFTYTIADGKGGFDTATVRLNVVSSANGLSITSSAFSASEEGLQGGNPDNAGNPQDNSNTSTVTGKMTIVDESGTATVSLVAPIAPISSSGQLVQWTGANSQSLIGTAGGVVVATLTINNQGNYAFQLFKPLDHSVANAEDILQLNVGVQVRAGSQSSSAVLTINLEDDAPAVISENLDVSLMNTNVMIVLDTSGSMNAMAVGTNQSKLEVAKESIITLLNAFDDAGDVRVRLVTFASSSQIVGDKWLTKAEAFEAIQGLQAGGATNYDEPLANAISAFESEGKLSQAQNISYFISDDDPNIGNGDELTLSGDRNFGTDVGIQLAEEAQWKDFLNTNLIKSYAIGVGTTIVSLDDLNPIAYDGQAQQDISASLVNDLSQLSTLLLETTPSIVNQTLKVLPGADGGYVQSLLIDGTQYSFNAIGRLVSVSGGLDASVFDVKTGLYTITLESGSRLEFNLANGTYDYRAPSGLAIADFSDQFDYVVQDKDGDIGHSKVHINVNQSVVAVNETTGGTLSGGNGFDTLYGSATQDLIIGFAGDDKIYGRAGDDVLQGGSGNDILTGGAGADVFLWTLADKEADAGVASDVIRDFNAGVDKLDLRDLLIGENNIGGIGNLLNYLSIEQSGANTVVHVSDTGGFSGGFNASNETLQITLSDVNLLQIYSDEQHVIQQILKQTN